MDVHGHGHEHACDCAAHAAMEAPGSGPWSVLIPVLACAICPACIATYAKLLSAVGLGFGMSEIQHLRLLVVAICVSVGISAWRSWRTRRVWPVAMALCGSMLVAMGHLAHELHALEWAGIVVLVAGGLTEHFRLRRSRIALGAVGAA